MKKAKAVVEESEEEEEKEAGAPDTAGDEELARALASEGKRESIKEKDKKAQRAKALADIRKVRADCGDSLFLAVRRGSLRGCW